MTDHTFRDAEIARAIDSELLRAASSSKGSPPRGASCAKPLTWRR